jgi:hypothetical protein
MPASWECVGWKARGGMSNVAVGESQAKDNVHRERVWFSPHCLQRAKDAGLAPALADSCTR